MPCLPCCHLLCATFPIATLPYPVALVAAAEGKKKASKEGRGKEEGKKEKKGGEEKRRVFAGSHDPSCSSRVTPINP